ncbi:hypothetical protein EP7_003152 [Isosphaeraceae bacterium EP7]
MRRAWKPVLALALAAPAAFGPTPSGADEPRGLGRFFRLGGSDKDKEKVKPTGVAKPGAAPASQPSPYDSAPNFSPAPAYNPSAVPPNLGSGLNLSPNATPGVMPEVPAPTIPAPAGPNAAGPRILPQPRNSRSITDSDPLVSRIALGRSDNGTQFAMFLQVYADGTVIDGEGVHHVGRETLKPILDAIQAGDVLKVKGHCGGPATDYMERVQVVVYERSMGRLRANSFSYSGNPQGCDHSIRHLSTALEAIQAKISGPAQAVGSTPLADGTSTEVIAPAPPPPSVSEPSAPPLGTPSPIGLTPIQ